MTEHSQRERTGQGIANPTSIRTRNGIYVWRNLREEYVLYSIKVRGNLSNFVSSLSSHIQVQFLKNRNPDFFAAANVTDVHSHPEATNASNEFDISHPATVPTAQEDVACNLADPLDITSSSKTIPSTTRNPETIIPRIFERKPSENDLTPNPVITTTKLKIIIPTTPGAISAPSPEAMVMPVQEAAIVASTPDPIIPLIVSNAQGVVHSGRGNITDSTVPYPGEIVTSPEHFPVTQYGAFIPPNTVVAKR